MINYEVRQPIYFLGYLIIILLQVIYFYISYLVIQYVEVIFSKNKPHLLYDENYNILLHIKLLVVIITIIYQYLDVIIISRMV